MSNGTKMLRRADSEEKSIKPKPYTLPPSFLLRSSYSYVAPHFPFEDHDVALTVAVSERMPACGVYFCKVVCHDAKRTGFSDTTVECGWADHSSRSVHLRERG